MQVYAFQGPILPGQHSIERYLIEEQLKHILQANRIERKDWCVSLIKISYITLKHLKLITKKDHRYISIKIILYVLVLLNY